MGDMTIVATCAGYGIFLRILSTIIVLGIALQHFLEMLIAIQVEETSEPPTAGSSTDVPVPSPNLA